MVMMRWVLPVAVLLLAAACVSAPDFPPSQVAPTQPVPVSTPTSPPALTPPRVRDPVQVAREALAKRVGVPIEEVEVVDWVTDTFPLDNLGCPSGPAKEGVVRPAMVVGHVVTLRVDEETYVYHVYGRKAVLCQKEGD